MQHSSQIIARLRVQCFGPFRSAVSDSIQVSDMVLAMQAELPGFLEDTPDIPENSRLAVFKLCDADPQDPTNPQLMVPYAIIFDAATENGMSPVTYPLIEHIDPEELATVFGDLGLDFLPILTPVCESNAYNAPYIFGIKKGSSANDWHLIRQDVSKSVVHPVGQHFIAIGAGCIEPVPIEE